MDLNRVGTDPSMVDPRPSKPKQRKSSLLKVVSEGNEGPVTFELGDGAEERERGNSIGSRFRKMSRIFSTSMIHDHSAPEHDVLLEPLFMGQAVHIGDYPDSPIHRVKMLVDDQELMQTRPIFCEMMELSDSKPWIWTESARWVKYEETVEEGGTRFSKPHITMLSIESILQMRNCLKRGASLFDVEAGSFKKLVDSIVGSWTERHELPQWEFDNVRSVLLAPKHHLLRNRMRKATVAAEVDEFTVEQRDPTPTPMTATSVLGQSKVDQSLMRKLPLNSEAAVVLVGHLSRLSQPLTEFVRLRNSEYFTDLPELPIPVRFLFILLIPHDHYQDEATMIGKCMGSLIVDDIFSHVAYRAKDSNVMADAVEEFLSQTVIVPPAKWDTTLRLEPPDDMPSGGGSRVVGKIVTNIDQPIGKAHVDSGLRRTGRLFGGVFEDVKRKLAWYPSDIIDAFKGRITQSLAAAIFLFFANVTKIITFGGVMGNMLHNNMAAVENLLSGGISGVIYALFSGQPLCVLSATGPTLVFEAILYDLCERFEWDYLPARCWVGVWTAVIILVLVALDASVLVALITRFTEEAFATLIQRFSSYKPLKNYGN